MKDLVSIIIPTYKRSKMLERAINSCLDQTYKNIEIIIIDDNNFGDEYQIKTSLLLEKFKNNKFVKYYTTRKNQGGALARNFGIEKSSGEYIAFLDDDDEFLPTKIEVQLKHLNDNKLDASFTDNEVIDGKTNKTIKIKKYNNFEEYENKLKFHLVEMIVGTQTFMVTKSMLKKIAGFEKVPAGQEYYLMYKILINGGKVGHIDKPLTKIYIHEEERITTGDKKVQAEKFLLNLKKNHFSELSFSERQLIKYRYRYNVAHFYKNNNIFKYCIEGLKILICHPIIFITKLFKKIRKESS